MSRVGMTDFFYIASVFRSSKMFRYGFYMFYGIFPENATFQKQFINLAQKLQPGLKEKISLDNTSARSII